MQKDFNKNKDKEKEVVELKVGNSTVLYALGLMPIGSGRITTYGTAPESKTGIFHEIGAHPDFIYAKENMNLRDLEEREKFFKICARIKREIIASRT